MSSFMRPAQKHNVQTDHLRVPPSRFKHLQPFAAVSLAAMILSACGGGDGSGSTDGTQAQGTNAKFESFVSANPQVRATIEATPYGTKEDNLTEEEAERASEDAASEDDSADSSQSDSASSDDSSDSSDSEASASAASGDIVDTLISDMREMNDHPLKDVNPVYGFSRGPGYVLAGTDSGGSNFLLPWFVQFEGEGNQARHTRIEMRNMRLFVKSHSGEWSRLNDTDSYSGVQCDQGSNYFHCPQDAQVDETGESSSTLPQYNLNLHGWWGGREPINSGDMAAIVVSVEARLIPDADSGIDDRSKAKYLLHVGADYYPDHSRQSSILPAVGVSRSKFITNEWQTFALTTLNDVGLQEPGGGISSEELRANPPPLN